MKQAESHANLHEGRIDLAGFCEMMWLMRSEEVAERNQPPIILALMLRGHYMGAMQVKKASDFKEFNVKLDAWVKTLMSQVNTKSDQDVRFTRLKDTIRSQLNRLTLTDKTQEKTVYKVKGSDWVVEACSNRFYVCWILKLGSIKDDIRAQKWFLSLSYYVSFERLFSLMEQESIEEVRFLSHQTEEW